MRRVLQLLTSAAPSAVINGNLGALLLSAERLDEALEVCACF